jgi:hypothetical protein
MLALYEAFATTVLRILTIIGTTGLLGFVLSIEFPLHQAKNEPNTLAAALRPFSIFSVAGSVILLGCALFG